MNPCPHDALAEESRSTERSFLAAFLAASLLLWAAVLLLYRQDLGKRLQLHELDGAHAVNLHSEIIASEFAAVESDLLFLAAQTALRDFLTSPDDARRKALTGEYLLFCGRKGIYDQVRFLDARGREMIRVNYNDGRPAAVAGGGLQDKSGRYYFREALPLDPGEVYMSPFDLNVEASGLEKPIKPTIRFATPVFDGAGRRRGILVLNYLGARLLRKLDGTSRNLPGGLMLLNGGGWWLNSPRPEDEWGFQLGTGRSFRADYPGTWPEVSRLGQGRLRTREGLFVFKVFAPATSGLKTGGHDGSFLRIVYAVPRDKLFSPSRRLLHTLLALALVIESLLGALFWLLRRQEAARARSRRLLRDSESRLRALSSGLIAAQEREREKLSRDLHDDLGQLLTVICLELERSSVGGPLAAADPGVVGRALESARKALERMREISSGLRPRILDEMGLKEAVLSLLEEYREKTGIELETELDLGKKELPPSVKENAYRILQEALANAAKHADTKKCRVALRISGPAGGPRLLELSVKDQGIGFDPRKAQNGSLGLLSMRERAELLGGAFRLLSEPGKGAEVRVEIPLFRRSA